MELADCETKGCGRLVKLPAGYCCISCSNADDRHVVLADEEHTWDCDQRQAVYETHKEEVT